MKAQATFYKVMYTLTVYLLLRMRDLCINAFGTFMKREYIIETASKLLKGKSLIGILPDGNRIFYPLDDFKLLAIISEIYNLKIYDVKQTESFQLICDVGAHIGLFTLRMSKLAPNSKIIAIEPHPISFKFLLKNIFIIRLKDRVYALNVAVGKKGRTALWLSKLSKGDSSTKNVIMPGAGHRMVDMLPLDDILPTDKCCDLIKIDVEGAETEVLKGLKRTFTKVNQIVMEIHTLAVYVTEIHELLRNYGFIITKTSKLYENCLLLEVCANSFKAKRTNKTWGRRYG